MRLKNLAVQGYKSFATKTEFVFSPGITAIIGPNGSGKSNVADAVRWVLGEQSMQALRGKLTTDMIFAGGRRRAQSGLAEVSLTLDNADGWLPIQFAEVTIGRRAHRSGENEYLINAARVRLRDVTALLADSGLSQRAYAVIGQGLVDAALSLRPQERRELFEEAAGITYHRSRREEAVRRLEEAQHNLERVHDIVNEIAPRLERLREEAQRVEEQQRLSSHLRRLQRTWYGHEWGRQQTILGRMQERAAAMQADLERRQARLVALTEHVERLRGQESELRLHLRDWHRQSADLHERADEIQRELAVAEERLRLERARRVELVSELEPLTAQRTAQAERTIALEADVAEARRAAERRAAEMETLEQEWHSLQEQAREPARRRARVDERLHSQRAELERLNKALRQAQAMAARLAGERAVAEERARHIGSRYEEVQQEMGPLAAGLEMQAERVAQARLRVDGQREIMAERQMRLTTVESKPADVRREMQEKSPDREPLEQALRTHRAQVAQLDQAIGKARDEAARLVGESDALSRAYSTGRAYGGGVRAVLEAGLAGCLGPLASLIRVPSELERIIETAFRETLRSIVVDRAVLGEEVRAILAASGGRVTILPLDSLRTPVKASTHMQQLADVVSCDPQIRPAVEAVFRNVVLCDDVSTAREVLSEMPPDSLCVTGDGAVLAASGAVSLGPGDREEMFAGERERQELPARVAEARLRCEELERQRAAELQQAAALEADLKERERQELRAREEVARARQDALAKARTEIAVIEEAVRSQETVLEREVDLLEQLRTQMQGLVQQAESLKVEQEALFDPADSPRAASATWAIAALAEELPEDEPESEGAARLTVQSRLEHQLRLCQALENQREAEVQRTAGLETALAELTEQVGAATERAAQFERETVAATRTALAVEREGLRSLETTLRREGALLDRLDTQILARRERVADLTREQQVIEQRIDTLREESDRLREGIEVHQRKIDPAEEQLARIGGDLRSFDEQERKLQARMRDAEAHWNRARLEVDRREDKLRLLAERIEEDLGLVELELADNVTAQTTLPLRPLVSELPVVEELPDGLEDEIQRLKAALRRLRGVNPQAPDEYREVRDRHQFLSEQSHDLEAATAQLRQAVTELDDLMERAFYETFEAVAGEFTQIFPMLFNGGGARLELLEPDDLMNTGVEIIAQPPGKRAQRLNLLSGGERALTATALLFALLRVSPAPFCVLDEVDAMLDEANVARFRGLLEDLAKQTQFVVITHNRLTIEAADTIYGVSMGADGASQVVSMKLGG